MVWPPPDRYSLQTREEIGDIGTVIKGLETRLVVARELSDPEQAILEELEQEIEQRRTWIAAVRRLPYDILSIIFLEATRQDEVAPLSLGGVCRAWRQSILDTPQIWSLVPLQCISSGEAIGIILHRGALYPLTINARVEKGTPSPLLANSELQAATKRIGCLKMGFVDFHFLQRNPFPNLTKLAIYSIDQDHAKSTEILLDGNRFPNLKCLATAALLETIAMSNPPNQIWPPIEELSVTIHSPYRAAEYLKRMAPHLMVLWVIFTQWYDTTEPRIAITFPQLHTLTIGAYSGFSRAYPWPLDASTPALLSYTQYLVHKGGNMHADTATVRKLAYAWPIDLAHFPKVQEVTTTPDGINALLRCLEENPGGWTDLRTLRCNKGKTKDVEEKIRLFNLSSGRNIAVHPSEAAINIMTPSFMNWNRYSS